MTRLAARSITKAFGPVSVLKGVDFDVHAGGVSALLGENGAGKSTLMKIIAGIEPYDDGQLLLDGKAVRFRSLHDAAAQGIGIVHQELSLCPNLTVTENIFLHHCIARGVALDHRAERARAAALLERLGADIDPDAAVASLSMGERQLVEIARALSQEVSILILDEPTSALSAIEADRLFSVIRELQADGVAIIYISHRMQEIADLADHVTVLRDGRAVAHATRGDFSIPWAVRNMIGEDMVARGRTAATPGDVVLALERVLVRRPDGAIMVNAISADIRAGEVTALYGLLGAGRTELFEAIFGVRHAEGTIRMDGADISAASLGDRMASGIGFVTEDRQQEGLFPNLSVERNASLPILDRLRRALFLSRRDEKGATAPMLAKMRVKTSSPEAPIGALSGGNQQKVLIGRALLSRPRLLMLDEPGRGVDVAARAEIFDILRGLAAEGVAILFATSDLIEATSAADRVLVMAGGRISGDFSGHAIEEESLVRAASATGHHREQAA